MSIKMTVFTFALSAFWLLASTVTLQAELVGYWNFDGNVDDLSGLENHGELIDAVYSDNVPDAIGFGQSLDFSFDTDHVFIANENGDLDSEEFTLSMFIQDRGQFGAMERLTSREGDTFETALNVYGPFGGQGEYAYYARAGGGWQWADEIAAIDEWQHVAFVANADEEIMQIYVDGELNFESEVGWFVTPAGFMHIGNRHNNVEGFDGWIDDVAIWDEVLDPEDIKTIAESGVGALLNPTNGDFNGDGVRDASDIDLLSAAIRTGDDAPAFDLNSDGSVNSADHQYMVVDLISTWFGDADLNGVFNSSDFVKVFQVGEYEDAAAENSGWGDGDWNGDAEFNSTDFVVAFQDGGFEAGPRAAAQMVPEPHSLLLLGVGVCWVAALFRRRS